MVWPAPRHRGVGSALIRYGLAHRRAPVRPGLWVLGDRLGVGGAPRQRFGPVSGDRFSRAGGLLTRVTAERIAGTGST
jgi:hypothetical protein